ncbi:MAG TPA: peptidoglycan DD-metalloendopeptidase family protein [Flavipsychrobacter sp.]
MRITALIISILLALPVFAQQQPTKAELEKRRQSIMESIKETQQQLEATKKDKNATMGQLRALQSKLKERQRLIGNINQEIGQINNNIQTSTQEVSTLKQNLEILKARYAQSVRYAYRSRSSYNMLAFIFSASNFNEGLRRAKYLKKYRDYRKQQADQIRITQGIIVKKIDVLNAQKSEKDMLLTTEEKQRLEIQKETNETDQVVRELKGREKELIAQIEKDKKATKQLDRAVQEIIRREIEIARKKAEEEARRRAEEERRKQEEAAKAAAAQNTAKVAVGSNRPAEGPINMGNNRTNTNSKSNVVANNNAPKTTPAATSPAAPKPAPKNYNYSLTPEANALSNSFESNRGRLPWPVEKGFVSQGFGKYHHAIATKVELENYGIDISTNHGATARAIFDGEVARVFYIPGRNWNVMITHGNYYTLYSMLESVTVKAGDKVNIKQQIGKVSMNEEGESIINLQIWKGTTRQNPETWIAR